MSSVSCSLKKATTQHKTELKHLGTVVINDLKSLKVKHLIYHLHFMKFPMKPIIDNSELLYTVQYTVLEA